MSDRFFAAVVLSGRFVVRGIGLSGPWNRNWLKYRLEEQIDLRLNSTIDRKAKTIEELEAAVSDPMISITTRNVWVHESLEKEAERLWETMKQTSQLRDAVRRDHGR
jgi:hypothetical protein